MDSDKQAKIGSAVAKLKATLNNVENQISTNQIDAVDWNKVNAEVGELQTLVGGGTVKPLVPTPGAVPKTAR